MFKRISSLPAEVTTVEGLVPHSPTQTLVGSKKPGLLHRDSPDSIFEENLFLTSSQIKLVQTLIPHFQNTTAIDAAFESSLGESSEYRLRERLEAYVSSLESAKITELDSVLSDTNCLKLESCQNNLVNLLIAELLTRQSENIDPEIDAAVKKLYFTKKIEKYVIDEMSEADVTKKVEVFNNKDFDALCNFASKFLVAVYADNGICFPSSVPGSGVERFYALKTLKPILFEFMESIADLYKIYNRKSNWIAEQSDDKTGKPKTRDFGTFRKSTVRGQKESISTAEQVGPSEHRRPCPANKDFFDLDNTLQSQECLGDKKTKEQGHIDTDTFFSDLSLQDSTNTERACYPDEAAESQKISAPYNLFQQLSELIFGKQ